MKSCIITTNKNKFEGKVSKTITKNKDCGKAFISVVRNNYI